MNLKLDLIAFQLSDIFKISQTWPQYYSNIFNNAPANEAILVTTRKIIKVKTNLKRQKIEEQEKTEENSVMMAL